MSEGLVNTLIGVLLGACITLIYGYYNRVSLWKRLQKAIMDRRDICLNEEYLLCRMLSEKIIRSKYRPNIIFAISPGGGMIAEWLSRVFLGKFNNPIPIRNINIQSTRLTSASATEKLKIIDNIAQLTSGLQRNSKVLIVNDISRGGESLRIAQEELQKYFSSENIKTAILICHIHSRAKPDYSVLETEKAVYFDWKPK